MIVYIEDVARAMELIAASELAKAIKLIADVDKLPLSSLGIHEGEKCVSPACLMRVLDASEGELEKMAQEHGNSYLLKSFWKRRLNEASYVLELDKGGANNER